MTVGADGTITTELIATYEGLGRCRGRHRRQAWISACGRYAGRGDRQWAIPNSTSTTPPPASAASATGETNLGDFVADGIYTYFNEVEQLHCDVAIMNGGGIRTDVEAGPWSFKTCKTGQPLWQRGLPDVRDRPADPGRSGVRCPLCRC